MSPTIKINSLNSIEFGNATIEIHEVSGDCSNRVHMKITPPQGMVVTGCDVDTDENDKDTVYITLEKINDSSN